MPNPLTFFPDIDAAVDYVAKLDTGQLLEVFDRPLASPWEKAVYCRDFVIVVHSDLHCELFRRIPETANYIEMLSQLSLPF